MGNGRAQFSFELELQIRILHDIYEFHGIPDLERERDAHTLRSRTHAEGAEFLSKTLPMLWTHILDATITRRFKSPSCFKRAKGSQLPRLFYGLCKTVFSDGGYFVGDDAEIGMFHLSQICNGWKKYDFGKKLDDLPFLYEYLADERVLAGCPLTEQALEYLPYSHQDHFLMGVAKEAQNVVFQIFGQFTRAEVMAQKPKPGSGADADHTDLHQRIQPMAYYPHLDSYFDYNDIYCCSHNHSCDHWEPDDGNIKSAFVGIFDRTYRDLMSRPHGTTNTLAVPKDSRKLRIISAEPAEYMFYQQAIRRFMVSVLEVSCPLTRGHVNFSDSSINGKLALEGSLSSKWATIDVSKASDFVTTEKVKFLFQRCALLQALLATRSEMTTVDIGEDDNVIVKLAKFAPMGSAVTFPVEATVFFAIAVAAQVCAGASIGQAASSTYVYGDDIIVEGRYASWVIRGLESFGFKVNKSKSFIAGNFRESCGVDAYQGIDITPVKFKTRFIPVKQAKPKKIKGKLRKPDKGKRRRKFINAQAMVAWLDYERAMRLNGYRRATAYIRSRLDAEAKGVYQIPYATARSALLGHYAPSVQHAAVRNAQVIKKSKDIERPRCRMGGPKGFITDIENLALPWYDTDFVKGYVLCPVEIKRKMSGWHRLFRHVIAVSTYRSNYFFNDAAQRTDVYTVKDAVMLKRSLVPQSGW